MECNNNIETLSQKQQDGLKAIIKDEGFIKWTIKIINNHEKGNNFQGEIIKIKINGINKNNQRINKNLIFKVASNLVNVRKIIPTVMFYSIEIIYYTKILPVLRNLQDKYIKDDDKFHFINCYKVNSEELEEFLVMDDVTVDDYHLEPRTKTLSLHHIKLAIQHIAYLHSLSFALRKYAPELLNEFIKSVDYNQFYLGRVEFYIKMTLSQAVMYSDDENVKKFLETFTEDACKKVAECITPSLSEPYNVLCHGDCWQNNMMFKCENGNPVDVIFLDWQLVKYCSPHVDLLHFLFSASDVNLRRNHYHELIDLYYNTLRTQLRKLECDVEEMYPEHMYKEHIKLLAPYALVYSIISANLLVREFEDVPDIDRVMKDGVIPDSSALEYTNKKCKENFAERVNGVLYTLQELHLL